jgi:hypothetical protein
MVGSANRPRSSGFSQPSLNIVDSLLEGKVDLRKIVLKSTGIGKVTAEIEDADGMFITRWLIKLNDEPIGHITRSRSNPSNFYAYSHVSQTAMKGTRFSRIRDAIEWLLVWATKNVDHSKSLAKMATVEEDLEIPDPDEEPKTPRKSSKSGLVRVKP